MKWYNKVQNSENTINLAKYAIDIIEKDSSFTEQLRDVFGSKITLKVLIPYRKINKNLYAREIFFNFEDKNLIYSISFFTECVLKQHKAEFDSGQPIGSWIFQQPNVRRQNLQFGVVSSKNKMMRWVTKHVKITAQELIVRRSLLVWDTGKILVYEFFLPEFFQVI